MDLFVLVQKLDAYGTPLQQFNRAQQSGGGSRPHRSRREHLLRYKDLTDGLRVSARHLDVTLSTDDVPAHTFDRIEKLSPARSSTSKSTYADRPRLLPR